MIYGLPYKGSKNSIAVSIVNLFPSGGKLVDCSCGGGAIIHAAALSGKFKSVTGYDIYKPIVELLKATMIHPETIDYDHYEMCSKEEFYKSRNDPKTLRDFLNIYTASFGVNGREFLWGEHKMYFKSLLHEAVMDTDAQSRYRKIITLMRFAVQNPDKLDDVCRSDQLSRLWRYKLVEDSLKGCRTKISVAQKSMYDVDIDKFDVFYFDPPYRNAARGYTSRTIHFDYEKFGWHLKKLKDAKKVVFVSEYDCPCPSYKKVWEQKKLCAQGADSNTREVLETVWCSV